MTSITSLEEIRQQRQGLQGPRLFHRAVAVFGEITCPRFCRPVDPAATCGNASAQALPPDLDALPAGRAGVAARDQT
jgi:hypothetical protein